MSAVNRYWDLTEKERAALTEENLKKFIDFELMEKGVVKVTVPILAEEEMIQLNKRMFFSVTGQNTREYGSTDFGALFEKIEDAQAFAALRPMKKEYEYSVGSEYYFAKPYDNYSINQVEIYTESEVMANKAILDRNAEIRKQNEAERKRTKEEVKAMKDATHGLYEDLYACKRKASRCQTIIDTFNSYLLLTNGDEQIAARFLSRAYSVEDIEEARRWFGVIPVDFVPDERDGLEAAI